jgi:hypothetical protein
MQDLAQEFATAARLYAEAVVVLATQSANREVFEHLRFQAKGAQERAEEARILFEAHVSAHSFYVADTVQERSLGQPAKTGSASSSRRMSLAAKAS